MTALATLGKACRIARQKHRMRMPLPLPPWVPPSLLPSGLPPSFPYSRSSSFSFLSQLASAPGAAQQEGFRTRTRANASRTKTAITAMISNFSAAARVPWSPCHVTRRRTREGRDGCIFGNGIRLHVQLRLLFYSIAPLSNCGRRDSCRARGICSTCIIAAAGGGAGQTSVTAKL